MNKTLNSNGRNYGNTDFVGYIESDFFCQKCSHVKNKYKPYVVSITFTFTFNHLADAFIQNRRTNEENNRSNQTIERATVYKWP